MRGPGRWLLLVVALAGCESLTAEWRVKSSYLEHCRGARGEADCKESLRKNHDLCFNTGYKRPAESGVLADPTRVYIECIELGFEQWNTLARQRKLGKVAQP